MNELVHSSHCYQQYLPKNMTFMTLISLAHAAFLSSFPVSLHLTPQQMYSLNTFLLLASVSTIPSSENALSSDLGLLKSFPFFKDIPSQMALLSWNLLRFPSLLLFLCLPSILHIFPLRVHFILPSIIVNLSSYLSSPQIINSLNARTLLYT